VDAPTPTKSVSMAERRRQAEREWNEGPDQVLIPEGSGGNSVMGRINGRPVSVRVAVSGEPGVPRDLYVMGLQDQLTGKPNVTGTVMYTGTNEGNGRTMLAAGSTFWHADGWLTPTDAVGQVVRKLRTQAAESQVTESELVDDLLAREVRGAYRRLAPNGEPVTRDSLREQINRSFPRGSRAGSHTDRMIDQMAERGDVQLDTPRVKHDDGAMTTTAAPKSTEPTIGVTTSSRGRTTTVTLPDGTTEQRTSKTKEYTHAVVVTTDNHSAAASMREGADRMERALAKAREIVASGDLTQFKRVPTSGSVMHGTDYESRVPGFEDVSLQLPDYLDKYAKRAQAEFERKTAQGATFPGIDYTPYFFANSTPRVLDRAEKQIAKARADADKLDAGPRYAYGVWRWSQSRTNAEKARGEFEGTHRTTRVIGVGDDITGQTADEAKPVKVKPTTEERKAAQAERAAAEKARVAKSNEEWTARKVADIREALTEGNEQRARSSLTGTTEKGLRAIAREFGIKSTPRGMAEYQKTEWLRNAILEAAKAPTGRPSGLPAKPASSDFEDLADQVSRLKTEAEIRTILNDLNVTELARLARKFAGDPTVLASSRTRSALNGLQIPDGLSIDERRQLLAKYLIDARAQRGAWR
jgi:hypothetical protein